MFEIKPRDRQLRGGTHGQSCNPLGRAGVLLPPLGARRRRADPQPQQGFASRRSSSLRGGSEGWVPVAPDAVLRRGQTAALLHACPRRGAAPRPPGLGPRAVAGEAPGGFAVSEGR